MKNVLIFLIPFWFNVCNSILIANFFQTRDTVGQLTLFYVNPCLNVYTQPESDSNKCKTLYLEIVQCCNVCLVVSFINVSGCIMFITVESPSSIFLKYAVLDFVAFALILN